MDEITLRKTFWKPGDHTLFSTTHAQKKIQRKDFYL